ncbi:MAG TPA: RidA family protein [Galbitalea sp.]|jgi:enamine deaminase RidA (YjgF/YER057c/UK114 family)|nr:RidA family protein [Galbitalea sp.]
MTRIRLVRAPNLAAVEYAYASTVSAGARMVYVAGACPLDSDGSVVGRDDLAAQTVQCLDNLVAALEAAGAVLTDVVETRVLVASSDRADLATVWDVYRERFGDHDVPSTLIGVAVLGYVNQLVEIEATAAVMSD